MQIVYKNLQIRAAVRADAPLLCRWWNDGAVMAHAGFPLGLGTSPEKIAAELDEDSDDTRRRLIIEEDNVPVGEMSFRNMGGGTGEIGIKICRPDRQNRGKGTLFLKMLITHLFSSGYDKIILDTNVKNTRARHVYEKLGFIQLRVNENAWKDQMGQAQSSVDYELTRENFTPLVNE